ncbi:MAG: FecR family protein [Sideroxydans sp.]|jgi:hypothetical protein
MKNSRQLLGLSGLVVLMLQVGTAWAATAGYAQFVMGQVTLTTASGTTRVLQKGEAINEGDTVSTSRKASAQIKMKDGGFIAVRPDTQLKFDSFVFTGKADTPERSFFSLFKGGFRAITGLIGRTKKQDYRITTPVATIGIRGTDHETIYLPASIPGAQAGAYSKVNIGETSLTTNKGTINVLPNQMGFAGGLNQTPQLQPINTNIFTVSAAPTKTIKESKEENKESNKAQTVDQKQQVAADTGSEKPSDSGSAEPIRDTAVVDNTKLAENIRTTVTTTSATTKSQTETVIETTTAAPQTVLPVKASSGGLTLNASEQTVTSGNTTVSVQDGIYSVQAKTAADAAQVAANAANSAKVAATSANTTLQAISPVNTAPATAAIGTASTNTSTATPLVTSALALPAVSTGTSPTSAQNLAGTAASQTAAANLAFTANGAFADSTAAPARTATQTANTALQSANTALQAAATTVSAQNTSLSTAKTAANSALTTANANLTTATNSLNTANTQNSTITTAQSAAGSYLSAANAAASAANTAALAAQAAATQAATLQAAGDLTGAAAQLVIAQNQLAIATTQRAAAQAAQASMATQLANAQAAQTAASTAVTNATSAANTANTAATTAETQASNANTASAAANTALTTVTSQLALVNTNATTVTTNAPIAAYNNPTVVSNNFTGHLSMPAPGTPSGYNLANENNSPQRANTQFVLDGNGSLVEMRDSPFEIRPAQSGSITLIANADIKWSGGTDADTFKLVDNSIYGGRWVGATVTVTDLAATPVAPFSLTPANSLWAVLLTPNAGYVQTLVGTTSYNMAGATQPFDTAGNIGMLNSATLSADFTSQLVNAALNLTMPAASTMAGTYVVTASNMPINTVVSGNGYGGFGGNTTPTISCTGTCAAGAGGYSADVGGSFAGTAAASAGLGYDIWPTVGAGLPVTDLVQGLVAFTAATAPTGAATLAYNPNHIAVETAGGLSFNSGMLAVPADLVYVAGGTSTSGALSSMTLSDIGGGSGWSQTMATAGGTATSADAPAFVTTGIQYGKWTNYTGQSNTWSSLLGGNNGSAPTSWMYGPEGYVDVANMALFAGAGAGTFTYQMDGGTAPRSKNTGLTGTLTSASLTVDFLNMLLSGNITLTMPGNENWGAGITNEPIQAGGAIFVNPVVTYGVGVPATTCITCAGSVNGVFTGQNLAGAIVSYDLYNNDPNAGGDVTGNVALTRVEPVTGGTPAPTGNIVVATGTSWGGIQTYPTAGVTTTGNVLTAFGSSGPNDSFATTINCPTCTSTASGQVASSGIYYGDWTVGSITQSYSATFPAGTMPPSYWITGPEAGPVYLPQALIGTASYTFDAGQVSNGAGVMGTVAGSTVLTLDFNKQAVGINLDVSIADTATTPVVHAWNVQTLPGDEATLGNSAGISGAGFHASTFNNGGGSGLLTVTVDGGATPVTNPSANVNGQLTGTGLSGAIMSFNLSGLLSTAQPTFENINGVAAFTGAAQSVNTLHRYVATSFYDPFAAVSQPVLGFYANNETRVTQDVAGLAGNLTQFDMQVVSNNSSGNSMVFAKNTSTLTDQGSDAVSGISWGRWSGGTFNATDRVTGVVVPVAQAAGGSLHWIAESAATSPTTLPLAGTYTYVNAGGTAPTDNLGNAGTLNSATLTANFTASTVNLGVNATVAGATMNAVGIDVPIIQKTVFYASSQEPAASTSYLNVSCSGSCGATLGGTVLGKFTGTGATGAAMTYGLQNGASTISGVAAFHQ